MSSLFPTRTIFSALGCLINDPMLLEESKIKLTREDFYAKDEPIFHVMIFAAINNLYNKGATKMQPADIDEYLSEFKDKYKVFTDNDGLQWCYQAVEYSNPENYSYYAEKIKKFSLLRQLHEDGISLAGIYDMNVDGVDEETQAQFDELTVDDIISKVQNKVHGIATAYQVGYDRASSKAGDNGLELLSQFKETPMYGHATQGELQNTIFRGALPKTSLLRSAQTNIGKCLVGDSVVFTDKGTIKIEDIVNHYHYNPETHELEAKVISYEPDLKKQVRPTSHWYDMGVHDTIKVVTEHGYEVEGTPEHPMMISRFGKVMWCRLDEITDEDYLIVSLNNQMFGTVKTGKDLSYILGFLTGDGYNNIENNIKKRTSLIYTHSNVDVFNQVNKMIESCLRGVIKVKTHEKNGYNSTVYEHTYGNTETIQHLKELGLTMNTSSYKEIPQRILQGTKEDLVSFLQGLFDTDGSMTPVLNSKREITSYNFEFSSASKTMGTQVQISLANLGVVSNRRVKNVKGRDYYIVEITNKHALTVFKNQVGFRLSSQKQRKLEKAVAREANTKNNKDKYINKPLLQKLHNQLKAEPNNGYHYVAEGGGNYRFGEKSFHHVLFRDEHNGCDRTNLLNGFETVGTSLEDPDILHIYNTVKNTMSSRVKTITKSRNRVYDFTVPETHSFVANALISHNTRMSIAEATDFAISKWYNYQTSQWEDRGEKLKVLFISTEMEEDELQPTMWSYVAGVKEEDIRDGKLSSDEEKAVRGAIEHLQECDLYIEYVPKFDPQTINAIIKEYAIQHQIDVVFFDYIHLSFEIMMEISSKTKGMTMREDMMLTIFAAGLEELAREYGFHLRTSTQMNGNSNSFDQSTQMLDQSLLRGAKAMADKMQYGIIMTRPTEKELGLIESIVTDTQRNFGGHPIMPNFVYHIYKNRKSKYKGKLWLYVDFDTMRQTELFMTDFNNNFIKVPKTDLLSITKD